MEFCIVYSLPHLKEQRRKSRLTQEELSILSGVGRDTIAKLETTGRRATPETIRKLARVLKIKPEDLV